MASPSIWRTNPNQEPSGSVGNNINDNSNVMGVAINNTPSHSTSKDPFSSSKQLPPIPDIPRTTMTSGFSNEDVVTSPNGIKIDDIITPRDLTSPNAQIPNQTGNTRINTTATNQVAEQPTNADWNYFGFTQDDVMSPVPDTVVAKNKNNKVIIPKTPPPPTTTTTTITAATIATKTNNNNNNNNNIIKTKDEEINKLRKELENAKKEIEKLNIKTSSNPPLIETPSFGSSTKKSINLKQQQQKKQKPAAPNDDEKDININKNNLSQKPDVADESLQKQQLARYKHFITCPACNKSGKEHPRNQVLIPCGHLICGKCSLKCQETHKCPLCDDVITNYQLLLIG